MSGPSEVEAPPTLGDIVASYGEVEQQPLSRIQSYTAKAMARNWSAIPHVTHFDRLDVTELEAARRCRNDGLAAEARLSPLHYLLKAVAEVLRELPRFNAALDVEANTLLLRKYVNLGVAIDTPAGLVVAVIRDCDQLPIGELAAQVRTLSQKARTKGLSLSEMSGSGFTVSSLGDLGGDGFTPIVNAPEVAILGASRLTQAPRRGKDDNLDWRTLLPVCLSYDHRALNGADAGRFVQALQRQIDRLAQDPAATD